MSLITYACYQLNKVCLEALGTYQSFLKWFLWKEKFSEFLVINWSEDYTKLALIIVLITHPYKGKTGIWKWVEL